MRENYSYVRVVSTGDLETKRHKERRGGEENASYVTKKKMWYTLLKCERDREMEGKVFDLWLYIKDETAYESFCTYRTTGFIAATRFGLKAHPSSGSYKC